ncbi:LysR family transcriptional regulator [Pandoraea terrae]|uniref:LysR family transcriptional regulator n=1 Tax=Pandoraea terrae TaxID=1537710 RepID=A0A5E4WK47_9BURK|nr:LysR family transcriptional regulator [Pandoraea terrae]VVE23970.1 LysR family transcriptional regulator [Pandoraea terrae]
MIRYLKTFVTAAETASFSAAGARLGLTQSAVSAQIQRLEDDLGCQLFERTGRAVTLSDDGRRLLAQARGIVGAYRAMRGEAGQHGVQAAVAPIDLGAILTVQMGVLPGAVRRWWARGAPPHLNIVPGMSVQLLGQIDARELDVAVVIKPRLGIPSDLKWLTLMHEHYVAIAPKSARGELGDWARDLPFLRYNRRSYGGYLVDTFLRRHKVWVRDGVELDEPEVILRMVRQRLGWSIVPSSLIGAARAAGVRSLPLPGAPLLREIGVLARQSALKRAPVASLVECLVEEAGALAAG